MNKYLLFLFVLVALSCKKEDESSSPDPINPVNSDFISAVDISQFPKIDLSSPVFKDSAGNVSNFLDLLKVSGVNTIRLKLWHSPQDGHSGLTEVASFSQELRNKGFKIWLTLHYSDSWADPGQQNPPVLWQNLSFQELMDSVYQYTFRITQIIEPEFIQIGNEINSGMLHPYGDINTNFSQFHQLLDTASMAMRAANKNSRIMLHFAGIQGSDWFFNQLDAIDYDIIGLSYYPKWHGKSFQELKSKMSLLNQSHQKDVLIAETAYPFTLQWNDWTNNIVGLDEHLILPDYPASPEGQRKFVQDIRDIGENGGSSIGFCYWGAELIAWKGNQATDASPWENQALFDFNNQALPALAEFAKN